MKVHLTRIDHEAGMARFYAVMVRPTLFGEWAVVREWGRIGQAGTVRDVVYADADAACVAANVLVMAKERRGYRRLAG